MQHACNPAPMALPTVYPPPSFLPCFGRKSLGTTTTSGLVSSLAFDCLSLGRLFNLFASKETVFGLAGMPSGAVAIVFTVLVCTTSRTR